MPGKLWLRVLIAILVVVVAVYAVAIYNRLVRLRNYWAERLLEHDNVRLHTSLRPGFACGIATVEIEGVDPVQLNDWLWVAHRIIATPIVHEEFRGIRVSPSVYTTLEELDRFTDAMVHVASNGLPDADPAS